MTQTITLRMVWGVSRGYDTAGYTTCSIHENGHRVASCNGGGYDLRGTAFGDWLQKRYQDRLLKIRRRLAASWSQKGGYKSDPHRKGKLYGGCWNKDKNTVHLDGACGYESILEIARAIGLHVSKLDCGSKLDILTVTDTRATD